MTGACRAVAFDGLARMEHRSVRTRQFAPDSRIGLRTCLGLSSSIRLGAHGIGGPYKRDALRGQKRNRKVGKSVRYRPRDCLSPQFPRRPSPQFSNDRLIWRCFLHPFDAALKEPIGCIEIFGTHLQDSERKQG